MKRILDNIESVHGSARVIETDSGPVYAKYGVEMQGESWELTRWYAPDEFDHDEALQFGAKVLNNPTYRKTCLNGDTSWASAQQLYATAESKIVEIFEESGVLSFNPSDFEGEKQAEWASIKLQELTREIYFTIRKTVDEFGLDTDHLEEYLNAQYSAATALTTVFNDSGNVEIGELRPADQFLVFTPDEDPHWESESLDLSYPTLVDVYTEEYGPVVAIALPPQLNDIIKKLDWEETHRQWQSDREVWEVDLEAADQLIDLFNEHEYRVKAARPVVEIIDVDPPDWPSATRPTYHRPLMKRHADANLPSGTDLLHLPGVGATRARQLLQSGFGSVPELAHSTVEAIAEVPKIRSAVAATISEGAQIILGEIGHPSVDVAKQTDHSISDIEWQIARLAAKGIPPTDAASFITETHESRLSEIEAIDIIVRYQLYDEGITTVSGVANLSQEELLNVNYVTDTVAEKIQAELSD